MSEKNLNPVEIRIFGKKVKQVAGELNLNIHTQNAHKSNALKKIQAETSYQAIHNLIKEGCYMRKKCSKCKREKAVDDFYKDRTNRDGRRHNCKDCCKPIDGDRYKRRREFEMMWL